MSVCAQGRGRARQRTASRLSTERGAGHGVDLLTLRTRPEPRPRVGRITDCAPRRPLPPPCPPVEAEAPSAPALTCCWTQPVARSSASDLAEVTRQNRKAAREASSSPQSPLPAAGSRTVRCGHRGRRPSNPNREPGLLSTRRDAEAHVRGSCGHTRGGRGGTRGRTGIWGPTGLGGAWPARERRGSVPG